MALSFMFRRVSPSSSPLVIRAIASSWFSFDVAAVDGVGHRRSVHYKSPDPDDVFIGTIRGEISAAKKYYNNINPNIPASFPFKIEDNPQETTSILLTRTHLNENIKLKVEMPIGIDDDDSYSSSDDSDSDSDDDDGEKDNQNAAKIPITMTICKGIGLCMECKITVSTEDIVSIDRLLLKEEKEKEKEKGDDPQIYTEFRYPEPIDRSSGFNKYFIRYLEKRGITPSTTKFLYKYMAMKRKRNYLPVLKKLQKFLISEAVDSRPM